LASSSFFPAAMWDCLGRQNRVHWQMQSRQFLIHSFMFWKFYFLWLVVVCQKNYISLQLLRKWDFSVHLLHNHNNDDDLINRMQGALDHYTLLVCVSLSTSSDRNAEKWRPDVVLRFRSRRWEGPERGHRKKEKN
jgi:hypothetical protein